MYTPSFNLTHKLIKDIVRAELALNEIKKTTISSAAQKKIYEDVGTQNIRDVASLIGMNISFDEARSYYTGKSIAQAGSPQVTLSNYRSTSDFIFSSQKDPYLSLSSSLVQHLNKLLMNSAVEDWEAGRFRSQTDEPLPALDPWADYSPKSLTSDPHRQITFVLQWFSSKKHDIHPIIKTSCVFYELFTLYPFVSGNFLTIVSTMELLIEKSPLSLRGLFPVASLVYANEADFRKCLLETYDSGNLTRWIEMFTDRTATQLISLKNTVITSVEKKIRKRKQQLIELNPRQKKIMKYLRYQRRINRNKYVELTGVSSMTAYRDLTELVKRKLIVKRGGGRSIHYILVEDNNTENNEDPKSRPVVRIIKDEAIPGFND